jgi:hypothetical protein
LNVFLSRRKRTPQDVAVGFDSRTWTLGNGFSLQVEGAASATAVNLPYAVRKIVEA